MNSCVPRETQTKCSQNPRLVNEGWATPLGRATLARPHRNKLNFFATLLTKEAREGKCLYLGTTCLKRTCAIFVCACAFLALPVLSLELHLRSLTRNGGTGDGPEEQRKEITKTHIPVQRHSIPHPKRPLQNHTDIAGDIANRPRCFRD